LDGIRYEIILGVGGFLENEKPKEGKGEETKNQFYSVEEILDLCID
jgi:hypothetical protein